MAKKFISDYKKVIMYPIEIMPFHGRMGNFRLWGNAPTVEASDILEFGFDYFPGDDDVFPDSYYPDGSGTYTTKESFLKRWESRIDMCKCAAK